MLFGGQTHGVGQGGTAVTCTPNSDGTQTCTPVHEEGSLPWAKIGIGAAVGVITLGFGLVVGAVALAVSSKRFGETPDVKPTAGPKPAELSEQDSFFEQEAERRKIPAQDRARLKQIFDRRLRGQAVFDDLNSIDYRRSRYGIAFEGALREVYPPPPVVIPHNPFEAGARTMVEMSASPHYDMLTVHRMRGMLEPQYQQRFDERLHAKMPIANKGEIPPGYVQAMNDTLSEVLVEREIQLKAKGAYVPIEPPPNARVLNNRSGLTVMEPAPVAENVSIGGSSLVFNPRLPESIEPEQDGKESFFGGLPGEVEFSFAMAKADFSSVRADSLVGNQWVLYDTRNFIEQLNSNANFKNIDNSKKAQVARLIAEGMLVQKPDGTFESPQHGAVAPPELVNTALRANGLDPSKLGNLGEIQVRRDPNAEKEAKTLGGEHAATVAYLESMESAGGRNYSERFTSFMATVPEKDRPFVRKVMADYLVARWNAMSEFQRKQIGGGALGSDWLGATYQRGGKMSGGVPSQWVVVQLEAMRRGDVSDRGLERARRAIELRQAATTAMYDHLRDRVYSDLTPTEKADIAKRFGEAVAGSEKYRERYFPEKLGNLEGDAARSTLLKAAVTGIAPESIRENAFSGSPVPLRAAAFAAGERIEKIDWLRREKAKASHAAADELRARVEASKLTVAEAREHAGLPKRTAREAAER